MSPRAAWRLESLGFADVSDYVAGKVDWMSAGLPTEGTNSLHPRAGDLARRDVVTCAPADALEGVRARAAASGLDAAVVLNPERVVLGLLRRAQLDSGAATAGEAMRPGPSTYRPYETAAAMAEAMQRSRLESTLVTTSDGRLVGLLLRADAEAAASG